MTDGRYIQNSPVSYITYFPVKFNNPPLPPPYTFNLSYGPRDGRQRGIDEGGGEGIHVFIMLQQVWRGREDRVILWHCIVRQFILSICMLLTFALWFFSENNQNEWFRNQIYGSQGQVISINFVSICRPVCLYYDVEAIKKMDC